ncbi:hypothetical protein ACFYS8_04760 [Kitasatospora sp. NPDC004615]|uniref:hypothetical protein n=1 Tax=Kitasatospora sp. NPDC004615 TaxID=3364017 RepID=UPI00369B68FD
MPRTTEKYSPELRDLIERASLRLVEAHELTANRVGSGQPSQFKVSIEPGLAVGEDFVNYRVSLTCQILSEDGSPIANVGATVVGQYGVSGESDIPEIAYHEFGPIAIQEIYLYARQHVYDLALRVGISGFVLEDIGSRLAGITSI